MRPSLLFALAVPALVLCACGKSQDATPAAPPPPADAPTPKPATPGKADFTKPINALGVSPFWALKIRPEGLMFSLTGAPDIMAPNEGPKVLDDTAVWTGANADNKRVTVTLVSAVCKDDATGQTYPFKATILLDTPPLLHGCATYAADMPKG